jgi:flagellar hook-length control protein FliK
MADRSKAASKPAGAAQTARKQEQKAAANAGQSPHASPSGFQAQALAGTPPAAEGAQGGKTGAGSGRAAQAFTSILAALKKVESPNAGEVLSQTAEQGAAATKQPKQSAATAATAVTPEGRQLPAAAAKILKAAAAQEAEKGQGEPKAPPEEGKPVDPQALAHAAKASARQAEGDTAKPTSAAAKAQPTQARPAAALGAAQVRATKQEPSTPQEANVVQDRPAAAPGARLAGGIEHDGGASAVQVRARAAEPDARSPAAPAASQRPASLESLLSQLGAAFAETVQRAAAPAAASAAAAAVRTAAGAEPVLELPVAAQIAGYLRAHGARAGDEMTIRLNPPELGSVKLNLQAEGSDLRAVLTAESERTYVELRREATALVERLAESGIQVRRIQVVLTTDSGNEADHGSPWREGLAQQQQAAGQQHGGGGGSSPSGRETQQPTVEAAPQTASRDAGVVLSENSINIWL